MTPLRSYLIRAVYDWAVDSGLTPHVVVDVTQPGVAVPPGRAADGRIVLNIDPAAVRDFFFDHDMMAFSARFGGVPFNITVPLTAVLALYARENGKGLSFEQGPDDDPSPPAEPTPPVSTPPKTPTLRRVK
ncbi:MAG: ClpXP protease specificity-enhancing factor [Gammaproteobacteria bacterium]|nr:ClpXP protease specificity-enhancing factor [Gammaproteobacteria bacterium]